MQLPQLIVFDLDFTLWNCGGTWCDCLSPPFRARQKSIFDRTGRHIELYDDVLTILDACDASGVLLALASRTEQPAWASELVEMLGIESRFSLAEIYPASKQKHFAALRKASRVEYSNMLFFDDEMRNIREVGRLGVTSIFVENGVSWELFEAGLRRHDSRRASER